MLSNHNNSTRNKLTHRNEVISNNNNNNTMTHSSRKQTSRVFTVTFATKRWPDVHTFATHCIHCIHDKTNEAKLLFMQPTNGIMPHADKQRWENQKKIIIASEKETVYTSFDSLLRHFKHTHYHHHQYTCVHHLCNEQYSAYKQLFAHLISHSDFELTPYHCAYADGWNCAYAAASKAQLMKHMSDAHRVKVSNTPPTHCMNSYPMIAGTIRPQKPPQQRPMREPIPPIQPIHNKPLTRNKPVPQTKSHNDFPRFRRSKTCIPHLKPHGIPMFRSNPSAFMESSINVSKTMPYSADNPHSIIFPYCTSFPLIPHQSTAFIAASGCYDDCISPLMIPIVPAAFKPCLHSQFKAYDKYLGNPIKKPYYKSYDTMSIKYDKPRDPHFEYHKEQVLPPKIYGHPQNINKWIKIMPEFHFGMKEKVEEYCKENAYWYKAYGEKVYMEEKKKAKMERKRRNEEMYQQNKEKWMRRRKKRRKRYLKRKKVKQDMEGINTMNRMDMLLIAAQKDMQNISDHDFTDCTTCSDYDSSSSNAYHDDGDVTDVMMANTQYDRNKSEM
eukprot:564964_1